MELGEDVEGTDADFVLAIARDEQGGRVAASCASSPVYGDDPGYSLDLMRRRPDSANGLTEFLIAERGAGARRQRLRAPLAQLRRLGPAARRAPQRRPRRPRCSA